MGLFTDLLLLPVTGPYRGVRFILECIQDQVNAEWLDERQIRAELMALSLRLDQGELTEEDYLDAEAALLERLNEARALREEPPGDPGGEVVVDADGADDGNAEVDTSELDGAEPDVER